jgi:hypothetical protein
VSRALRPIDGAHCCEHCYGYQLADVSGLEMFTNHWMPNLSVTIPNMSLLGALSSGLIIVPAADSFSKYPPNSV